MRSVFLQGLLLASPDSIPERTSNLTPFLGDFWSICRDWGVPPIEAALNYVHRKLPYASIVVGARSATELEKIRGSSGGTYTDGVHHALEGMGVPSWRSVDPRKW